jgi:hypothetical protein
VKAKPNATVAVSVTAELSDEMRNLLEEMRGRLIQLAAGLTPVNKSAYMVDIPVYAGPIREEVPARPAEAAVKASMPEAVALGQRQALQALLGVLDDWIERAWANHKEMAHRPEPVGAACWRQFHPADIRIMVNDTAKELGLPVFAAPERAIEDNPDRRFQ